MAMENLNQIIAKNISEYRKVSRLTQLELADKINYSDKAVSKWERGDGMPDVEVLMKMAEIFGVSLTDMVSEKKSFKSKYFYKLTKMHICIALISVGLVWLIATSIYALLAIFTPTTPNIWLSFIYAIPVTLIVLLIYNFLWGNSVLGFAFSSALIWTTIMSITLSITAPIISYLYLIGIPLQIIVILWLIMIGFRSKKKRKV